MKKWMLILALNTNGISRDKEKAIPELDNFFIAVLQIQTTQVIAFFRKASFC